MNINESKIASIYLGQAGKCMCGCSGNYAYSSIHAEWSGKNRGYALSPAEINDKKIKMRLKKFFAMPGEIENIDDRIFSKENGTRQITIYMQGEQNEKLK